MSPVSGLLNYQVQSTAWANQRILAATGELTEGELLHDFNTSEHSILHTLVHIYRAERIWLSRIEGLVVEFRADCDDTVQALATNWPALSQRWLNWAGNLTEEAALAELTYFDLRHKEWTQPVWQIVLHVVNHSTHHRGQVSGFLRALGHTPPNTDSITFARQS